MVRNKCSIDGCIDGNTAQPTSIMVIIESLYEDSGVPTFLCQILSGIGIDILVAEKPVISTVVETCGCREAVAEGREVTMNKH